MPVIIGLLVLFLLLVLAFWITAKLIGVIILLVVAGLVGWVADQVVPGSIPYGWLGAIIAGLIGSFVGAALFSMLHLWRGPVIEGIPIIPAIVGAIILAFVINLVQKSSARPLT
ncbi:MAG: GlsB/YeaQ/YmgE family stress response membrane protein [Chloroflexi bacterium]|nr:GlsB/YeaQ/YmgE family stress response membrane protein [Chloroflexota bacterium]MDA8188914.1 GlsB/YeaQ/YmgE family stress response membrane protein [Dehalococcoidales bacterium]